MGNLGIFEINIYNPALDAFFKLNSALLLTSLSPQCGVYTTSGTWVNVVILIYIYFSAY